MRLIVAGAAPSSNAASERPDTWARLQQAAGLLATVATLAVAGFTWVSIRQVSEGQITDRYNNAVADLGSDSPDVRIGSIYALQRIMQDSKRDQPAVVSVLSAYVRTHAPQPKKGEQGPQQPPDDVSVALATLVTRNTHYDGTAMMDLHDAYLANMDLHDLDLHHAVLIDASLRGTNLTYANLSGADLLGADLTDAKLDDANMTNASLDKANLHGASLDKTNLHGASLRKASLYGATLVDIDLRTDMFLFFDTSLAGASLISVNLHGAYLRGIDLHGAFLADQDLSGLDLSGANLSGARLEHVKLRSTDLTDANLSGANLLGADLTGAFLVDTNLEGAENANLTGAIR
ncbi:pentapeptide repeat-containing protein [Streptomyces cocklensis]|uniref:pentapeptide repeat-containing protein n=1 Tax=Actinacidiphila cocklensis TaxID=887465 RepID=UPI00203D5A2F|nr:pentapeptide repeat-containing protein [Actinacidiphila cocklensis]MDD1062591.1 pentapeptide repeat-containing protein [Actinacidiphila cocklensis]WSX72400.1 pentapeptide repeat-containing protein [Streptomyces sp. NBC_00899]WSX81529.1 pentapeptide repeat-containing protein [Streptomyces sp. NBC_00899]